METRTIKELLEIMLYNQHLFYKGLCLWNERLYSRNIITYDEFFILKGYIKGNRPFNISTLVGDAYFWKVDKIEPRVKWLEKHIKKNS